MLAPLGQQGLFRAALIVDTLIVFTEIVLAVRLYRMLAAVGYLAETLGRFAMPDFGKHFGWVVILPAIGELSFTLWLLIKGVRRAPALEPGVS